MVDLDAGVVRRLFLKSRKCWTRNFAGLSFEGDPSKLPGFTLTTLFRLKAFYSEVLWKV